MGWRSWCSRRAARRRPQARTRRGRTPSHELGRVAHGDQPPGEILGWHVAEVLRVERLGFVVLGLGHGVSALELNEPDAKLQGLKEFHLIP